MPLPSVYLDECVHAALADELRHRGFTVTTAAQEGMTGIDDELQLSYASVHGWLILSYNRRDFERLHQSYERRRRVHAGIILLQQKPSLAIQTLRAAMMLDWIGTLPSHYSRLFKWSQLQQLLDRGHRPAGYSDLEIRLASGQLRTDTHADIDE
jgi:hypothetical protein